MKIGDRLRLERLRLGLNQADFAALAGVTKTSQFNYEKGERSPDANYLAAIKQHGADVYFILTGDPLPIPETALSPVEAEIVGYFRAMPDFKKESLQRVAYAMSVSDAATDSSAS